jgi:hypothetical protein
VAGSSRPKSRHGRGRGRSRKRRPVPGAAVLDPPAPGGRKHDDETAASSARARARANSAFGSALAVGERPPAPWHPWPLSELLILVGGVGAVVGLARLGHGGIASGGPVLFAGLGAVVIGTLEITWREHRSGYRSHALLLALLPVVVFHTVVILALAAVTTVPRLFNFALLALDAAIFAGLFKLLRANFQDARARIVSRR